MKWIVKVQYWLFDPQKFIGRWGGIVAFIFFLQAVLTL